MEIKYFLIELFLLFVVSRAVVARIYLSIHKLSGSKKTAVVFFSTLFLPGTYVHEMAHYLTAVLLAVPVGELDLGPRFEERGIRLGSVEIAKTDPVRRFVVAFAPMFVGILSISALVMVMYIYRVNIPWWGFVVGVYMAFVIGNTMFLSRRDLEAMGTFMIIIVAVTFVLGLFGVDYSLVFELMAKEEVRYIFRTLDLILAVVIGLNVAILGIFLI